MKDYIRTILKSKGIAVKDNELDNLIERWEYIMALKENIRFQDNNHIFSKGEE